jgi:hypothetical protein
MCLCEFDQSRTGGFVQGFEDESSLDMKLSTGFHNLSGEVAAIHCGRQFAAGIHWA